MSRQNRTAAGIVLRIAAKEYALAEALWLVKGQNRTMADYTAYTRACLAMEHAAILFTQEVSEE